VAELCELDLDAAAAQLARAGGEVKAAVVMHRLGLSLEAARARLGRHGGTLRAALGE